MQTLDFSHLPAECKVTIVHQALVYQQHGFDGWVCRRAKKEFQVGKRVSERAGLLFTTYCGHNPVNFTIQDVHSMDLTDPFDCDCRKHC